METRFKRKVARRLLVFAVLAALLIGHRLLYRALYGGVLEYDFWRRVNTWIQMVAMPLMFTPVLAFVSTLMLYFIGRQIPRGIYITALVLCTGFLIAFTATFIYPVWKWAGSVPVFNLPVSLWMILHGEHGLGVYMGVALAIVCYPKSEAA